MNLIEYIIFNIIMGIYVGLLIWKQPTIEDQLKYYYYGLIMFFILWTLAETFYLVVEQLSKGTFEYNFYYAIYNFFMYMGATIFMFVIERYVYKRVKYIPSIILTIATICSIMFFNFYGTSFTIILTTVASIVFLIIPIIYYKIAYETDGMIRIKALMLGSSMVIFMLGVLFNAHFFFALIPIMYFIAPIIQLVGAGIYIYSLLFYKTSQD